MKNKRAITMLLTLSAWLGAGCFRAPPNPAKETIRNPELRTSGQIARENEALELSLVVQFEKPRFEPDRLDPKKYEPEQLSFFCLKNCPEGFRIDPLTGLSLWTPSFDDAGLHAITYRVSSGLINSDETVEILVEDVDRPPVFSELQQMSVSGRESEPVELELSATDADGDEVSYRCAAGCPAGAELSGSTFKWTPSYRDSGEHLIEFRAESAPARRDIVLKGVAVDQQQQLREQVERATIDRSIIKSSALVVSVVVENSDQPVRFDAIEPKTTFETTGVSGRLRAEDPDGSEPTFRCVSGCPANLELEPLTGEYRWTPGFEDQGQHKIVFEASAGAGDRVSQELIVSVLNTNRPPRFSSLLGTVLAKEGELIELVVAAKDDDLTDKLTLSCADGCPQDFAVDSGSMRILWTPGFEAAGRYDVKLRVTDGSDFVDQLVRFDVEHVNRAPSWLDFPTEVEAYAMQALSLSIGATDPDAEDSGRLRFSCEQCPETMSIDALSGQISWFPTWDDEGTHEIVARLTDGYSVVAGSFVVRVIKLDRAPQFENLEPTQGIEFSPYAVKLTAVDPDGDEVRYECVAGCDEKIDFNQQTGAASFVPGAQDSGQYELLIRAYSNPPWDDDLRETKSADFQLNFYIRNNNRPPSVEPIPEYIELFENDHQNEHHDSLTGPGELFSISASDLDLDRLNYLCLENCPPGLAVKIDTGEVSWRPSYAAATSGGVLYEDIVFGVFDGEASVKTGAIDILVKNVNRPPSLVSPTDVNVYEFGHKTEDENSPTGFALDFTISAIDPDGDALNFTCVAGCPADLVVEPQSGRVRFVPSYFEVTGAAEQKVYSGVVYEITDGEKTLQTEPHSITVINVNRAPRIAPLASRYTIFEMGHATSDECSDKTDFCPSEQQQPLDFVVSAVDPDGDAISFSCEASCPRGLEVDEQSGRVFWRPSYLDSAENEAALNENALREGFRLGAADLRAKTLSTISEILVLNVDRSPRFTSPGTTSIEEGSSLKINLDVVDPDGDIVEGFCRRVDIFEGNERIDFAHPRVDCLDGYSPTNSFGYSRWLSLDKDSLELSLSPSFFDALKHEDPYQVSYEFSSYPAGFSAGSKKTSIDSHEIVIKNVDRPAPISAPQVNPSNFEGLSIEFSLFGGIDPDSLYGEFLDALSYSCVEEVDEHGESIGPCPDDNRHADGETNNKLTVDEATGLVRWTPSYLHAKFVDPETGTEKPYRLRFKVSSMPDGFSSPAMESSVVVPITVLNSDRLPEFVLGKDPNPVHLWEPEPDNPDYSPEMTATSVSIFGEDPALFPDSAEAAGGALDLDNSEGDEDTEEQVSYLLDGCSDKKGVAKSELVPCPDWVTLNAELGEVSFVAPDYNAAVANGGMLFVYVSAFSCPLEQTGWTCGYPFQYPVDQYRSTMTIPVIIYNVDRPPVLEFDASSVTMLETEEPVSRSLRWTDPDGTDVKLCYESLGADVPESGVEGPVFDIEGIDNEQRCFFSGALGASGEGLLVVRGGGYNHVKRHDGVSLANPSGVETLYKGKIRYGKKDYQLKIRAQSAENRFQHQKKPEAVVPGFLVSVLNDDREPVINISSPPSGFNEMGQSITAEVTYSDADCEDSFSLHKTSNHPGLSRESGSLVEPSVCAAPYVDTITFESSHNLANYDNNPAVYNLSAEVCYQDQPDLCFSKSHSIQIHNVLRPPTISALSSVGGRGVATEINISPINYSFTNPEGVEGGLEKTRLEILHVDSPLSAHRSHPASANEGSGDISFSGSYSYLSSCHGCSRATEICPKVRYRVCYERSPHCSQTKETRTCFTNEDRPPEIVGLYSVRVEGRFNVSDAKMRLTYRIYDPDPEDRNILELKFKEWRLYDNLNWPDNPYNANCHHVRTSDCGDSGFCGMSETSQSVSAKSLGCTREGWYSHCAIEFEGLYMYVRGFDQCFHSEHNPYSAHGCFLESAIFGSGLWNCPECLDSFATVEDHRCYPDSYGFTGGRRACSDPGFIRSFDSKVELRTRLSVDGRSSFLSQTIEEDFNIKMAGTQTTGVTIESMTTPGLKLDTDPLCRNSGATQ